MCPSDSTSSAFAVGNREIPVAWGLAVEIRDRCMRADDPFAQQAAARMRAASASRPVTLTREQFVALFAQLERWQVEAETARRRTHACNGGAIYWLSVLPGACVTRPVHHASDGRLPAAVECFLAFESREAA